MEKEIKKVLLCGIGAIGSIYANKFIQFDRENFRVLLDKNRLKRYRENPVTLNGKILDPIYILPDDKDFKADLIIIATKNDGLDDAVKNIENFVYDNTTIISLLNGVTSEKLISSKYGLDKVLHSYFIGHSAMRKGREIIQDGVNTIVFGSDKQKNNVERVKRLFDNAQINYEIPNDITYSIWLKYMLNVSSNQVSAILGFTFGEMLSNPKCMELITNIMKEVQLVAKAEGVKNSENLLKDALKIIKTMSPTGKTSMLQDVLSKRKTEVDIFAGTMIEYGKKYNIPTPYNTVIKNIIESIEQNY